MSGYTQYYQFKDLAYPDPVLRITVKLCGKYSITFSKSSDMQIVEKCQEIFEEAVSAVILALGENGVGYENIHRNRETVRDTLKAMVDGNENMKAVMSVEDLVITELYPSDSEYPAIIKARKALAGAAFASKAAAQAQGGGACSKCGARLSPGAKFCNKCGTPVNGKPQPPKGKVCPFCGADLSGWKTGVQFCSKCGKDISGMA